MVGSGIAAALLACQMASQAYREEEQRQEKERTRRNNFYFHQGVRSYSDTASQCNWETACPNEFTTGYSDTASQCNWETACPSEFTTGVYR